MKKICVLTSGGDAPGMNACIKSIFNRAAELGIEVYAARGGYDGLIRDDIEIVTYEKVHIVSGLSGCVFKCGRSEEFTTPTGFQRAIDVFRKHKFTCLIVIGGNGSFAGIKDLKEAGIPTIGIPATIDNDIGYTKHCLGFSSACENALCLIDMLKRTMETNDRDHVVQLMGRHCSDIAQTVGEAALADVIDVNGNRHTPKQIAEIFAAKHKQGKTSCLMIMQERKNVDVVLEAVESANFLRELIAECNDPKIRMNTLGHLQRGADPSCRDRYLAQNYGRAAVELANAGKSGVAVGLVNDAIKILSIDEVSKKLK